MCLACILEGTQIAIVILLYLLSMEGPQMAIEYVLSMHRIFRKPFFTYSLSPDSLFPFSFSSSSLPLFSCSCYNSSGFFQVWIDSHSFCLSFTLWESSLRRVGFSSYFRALCIWFQALIGTFIGSSFSLEEEESPAETATAYISFISSSLSLSLSHGMWFVLGLAGRIQSQSLFFGVRKLVLLNEWYNWVPGFSVLVLKSITLRAELNSGVNVCQIT
jgi:hypothetical protein